MASRPKPPSPEDLLPPALQDRLRLLKDLFFRRRETGDVRGGAVGPTPEFDTHRPYEPGDDPRSIDWNLYARTEKLLLKMFIVEDESQVCVLLDTSGSMRVGPGRKALLAARFAAAFSFLALAAGRPLLVGAFAEGFLGSRGPLRSTVRLPECLRFFAAPPAGLGTRLGPSVAELLATRRRRCFLIVISDFLQEGGAGREIAWLRDRKHELHLVRVLEDDELEPRLRGACAVTDAEGAGALTLHAGEDFRRQLLHAAREHHAALETTCRGLSVPLATVRASQPFERAFFEHLQPGLRR
jgi:uncharacterized protein (DUF58 family)